MRKTANSDFPELRALARRLELAMKNKGAAVRRLNVLHREEAPFRCSSAGEIVTLRFDKGGERRLYCKYGGPRPRHTPNHRLGVAYEAAVYRDVLQPLKVSTPRLYGAHVDPSTGETWLFLEYLEKSLPLNHAPNPELLVRCAARWIGEFQTVNELGDARAAFPWLAAYDAEYYRGWSRRTLRFTRDQRRKYPWLEDTCRQYEDLVGLLVSMPLTVIHGEYESDNLLVRDGIIYPVDWESCAVSAGEIDIANLTWGWPQATIRACELEYQRARWPKSTPTDFQKRLGTARMYLLFRWLGDRRDWTRHGRSLGWFKDLQSVGEQMGLI